jgi:hypothetical protein
MKLLPKTNNSAAQSYEFSCPNLRQPFLYKESFSIKNKMWFFLLEFLKYGFFDGKFLKLSKMENKLCGFCILEKKLCGFFIWNQR